MRLHTGLASSTALLVPFSVAGVLTAGSWGQMVRLASSPLLAALSFVLALLLFGFAYTVLSPWLTLGKASEFGASAIAGSLAIYVLGSYVGAPTLHWVSVLTVYAGLVLFLGGRGLALSVLPSVFVVGLVPFIGSAPSSALAPLAASYSIGIAAAGFMLYRRLSKRGVPEDCGRCSSYRDEGRDFCLYCGKRLSQVTTGLSGRRIVVVLSIALILALALQVTLSAVTFGPAGLRRVDYGLVGVKTEGAAVLPQGWSVVSKQQYASPFGEGYAYNLADPASTPVTVRVGISSNQGYAESVALEGSSGNFIGSVGTSVGLLPVYNLTEGEGFVTGLVYQTSVTYDSGQSFTSRSITYVIEGGPSSISLSNASRAVTVVAAISNSTSYSVASLFFTEYLATPVLSYPTATGAAASLIAVGLVSTAAMSVSIDSASRFENSLSLGEEEFRIFTLMPRRGTGRELLEWANRSGYSMTWPELQGYLVRMERMRLVSARVRGGNPAMVWQRNG